MTLVIKLVAAGWFGHNNVIVQPEIVGNVQSKILTEGKWEKGSLWTGVGNFVVLTTVLRP